MAKIAKFSDYGQFEKHVSQIAPIAHDGQTYFWSRSQYVSESLGASDAGKPIVLDDSGLIDSSMLPAAGASTFLDLTDTPDAYTGQGGKVVAVKSDVSGLEFITAPTGGVDSFIELDDVPSSYSGCGGYVVKVNSGATALEFVAGGGGVASFTDLDDVPSAYTDSGLYTVIVNYDEDALEFAEMWHLDTEGIHFHNHVGIGSMHDNTSEVKWELYVGTDACIGDVQINIGADTGWGCSGFALDSSEPEDAQTLFGICKNSGAVLSGGYTFHPLMFANKGQFGTAFTGTFDDVDLFFTLQRSDSVDDKIGSVNKRDMATAGILVGSDGSGNGQYSNPWNIVADNTYLYVVDSANDRVQKLLKSNGSYVDEVAIDAPSGIAIWEGYLYVCCGSGESYPIQKYLASDLSYVAGYLEWSINYLDGPIGICIGTRLGTPRMFILDYGYQRVYFCDLDGTDGAYVGTGGTGDDNYSQPLSICTDGQYVYVVDTGNDRVKKLGMDASYQDEFALDDYSTSIAADEEYIYVGSYMGEDANPRITRFKKNDFSVSATYDVADGGASYCYINGLCIYRRYSTGDLFSVSREGWSSSFYTRLDLYREMRFYERASSPWAFVSIEAAASMDEPYYLVLPDALPTTTKVLTCDEFGILEWGSLGGVVDFVDLGDVPTSYTGHGSKFVKVNSGETGLEFVSATSPAHNILDDSVHSDAVDGTVTAGDLIYGNATPKWDRLAKGADGELFEMVSGVPAWGRKITVSDTTPTGGSDGDIHFEY